MSQVGWTKGPHTLQLPMWIEPCMSWRSHSHWHRTWAASKHAGELRVRKRSPIQNICTNHRVQAHCHHCGPTTATDTLDWNRTRKLTGWETVTLNSIKIHRKYVLHCFSSKQFCYKRVLEWACILTGRKKENEKWILDTPLEIDTDRGLRPDKRKVNTSALKQNKTKSKKKKKRHCLLPPSDRAVAFSLSILNNTAVKRNVLCWIASPQSRQRTSEDTLVKSKGTLKLSW